MMNHVNIFLNTRVEIRNEVGIGKVSKLGDFCLTPVRCLFNGHVVTIVPKSNQKIEVFHRKAYGHDKERTFLQIIQAIVLLVPGIIFGTVLKGLTYLSKSIRDNHQLIDRHYTPTNRVIGSKHQRVGIDRSPNEILRVYNEDLFHQETASITIYAQPGTELTHDLGIMLFNPKKIIFVGAKLARGKLNDRLHADWETQIETKPKKYKKLEGMQPDNDTYILPEGTNDKIFITQWKMDFDWRATLDVPPRKSFFSSERYTRIYYVEN